MFSKLRYELHLISTINRLFGPKKALLFIMNIPRVLLSGQNRSAFNSIGTCSTIVSGKAITFRHPDPRFIDEIVVRHSYNPDKRFDIRPNATVVDAGANVGTFSVFAGVQATSGKVFAIEPEQTSYRFLKDNIESNGLKNVQIINAALSDESGIIDLHIVSSGSNTILYSDSVHSRIQKVRAITMDDLLSEYGIDRVDLLKMDIEGAEFMALRNPKWLERVISIAMEVHLSAGSPREVVKLLQEFNFQVTTAPAYDEDCVYVYANRI